MWRFLAPALISFSLAGCGAGTVVVHGKILLNDQPFSLEKKEQGTVSFNQIRDGGKGETFPTRLNPDGTFVVVGFNRQGIPPGKYRVSLVVRFLDPQNPRADLGAYRPDNSPWIVEVRGGMPELSLSVKTP